MERDTSSPHFTIICQTCKLAIYPPAPRGPFWTALEDFIVEYHTNQGHKCDKWNDETLYADRDDGKLYLDYASLDGHSLFIDDWYQYAQLNLSEEYSNYPKRNAKTQKYLEDNELIAKSPPPQKKLAKGERVQFCEHNPTGYQGTCKKCE